MIDRAELFARWHSLALMVGTRAAGGTQNLQPDTITGSHAIKSVPSAGDWMERRELNGGMAAWLESMNPTEGRVDKQMHEAITRASGVELDRLIGRIERAEWLLKVKWTGAGHRNLRANESDIHGREAHERSIIMGYRGVGTTEAARDLKTTVGRVRWIRRKHGLSSTGERIYRCTVAALNSCAACRAVNVYSDDYTKDEPA